MVEIIPAINCQTQEDYERKLKLVEPYTNWIQVDIEDGIFAPRKTIRSDVVGFYETPLKIEVQLLVADVESWVEDFLAIGVDRIVFPIKTAKIVVEAGADILISGSYVFESNDVQKAIRNLKEVVL